MTARRGAEIHDHPAVLPPVAGVTAVASGKGGVGKTWLSTMLARALAQAERRVLVVDADLGLANLHVQLGVDPPHDLGDVMAGRAKLGQAVHRVEAGYDILPGRAGSGGLASLPVSRLAALRGGVMALSARYDDTLLDLGAGVDRAVRTVAAQASRHLVVTTEDPTAITDAYAYVKLSAVTRPDADFRVVVNMAESEQDGRRVFEALRKACESFLSVTPRLAGVIRRDRLVRDAIRQQAPLFQVHPEAQALRDVTAVALALRQD